MTTKKTRSPAAGPQQAAFPGWTKESNAGRQQITVAVESAGVMLRGFEAMRQITDRAVQDATLRYSTAATRLIAPHQPLDLLAIPSELMRSEFEDGARYWQELSGAALEMQAELLGCSSHLIDSEALLEAASAVKSMPVLNAFNGFFGTHRVAPA